MQKFKLILAATAIASLSACLDSDIERGAAGVVAGVVVAEATGVDPVTGAIIGGVAGGFCDEVTTICR